MHKGSIREEWMLSRSHRVANTTVTKFFDRGYRSECDGHVSRLIASVTDGSKEPNKPEAEVWC